MVVLYLCIVLYSGPSVLFAFGMPDIGQRKAVERRRCHQIFLNGSIDRRCGMSDL